MPLAKATLPRTGLLRGTGGFGAGPCQVEPFKPQTQLERGRAPAPPRAASGAVWPRTSSSFGAENPPKCRWLPSLRSEVARLARRARSASHWGFGE